MSKTIYIMHPTLDYLLDDEEVWNCIQEQTMEENLIDLTVPLASIDPRCIDEQTDFVSFFRGMTLANIKEVIDSQSDVGFINPFPYGIIHDSEYTVALLSSLGFEYNFKYIDIPFEVYWRAIERQVDEDHPIYEAFIDDKETYDHTNEQSKEIVDEIVFGEYAFGNASAHNVH